jgi:hypothetical protein
LESKDNQTIVLPWDTAVVDYEKMQAECDATPITSPAFNSCQARLKLTGVEYYDAGVKLVFNHLPDGQSMAAASNIRVVQTTPETITLAGDPGFCREKGIIDRHTDRRSLWRVGRFFLPKRRFSTDVSGLGSANMMLAFCALERLIDDSPGRQSICGRFSR